MPVQDSYRKRIVQSVWSGTLSDLHTIVSVAAQQLAPKVAAAEAAARAAVEAEEQNKLPSSEYYSARTVLDAIERFGGGEAEWRTGDARASGPIEEILSAIDPRQRGDLTLSFGVQKVLSASSIKIEFQRGTTSSTASGAQLTVASDDVAWGVAAAQLINEKLRLSKPGWAWFRTYPTVTNYLAGFCVGVLLLSWTPLVGLPWYTWLTTATWVSLGFMFGSVTQRTLPCFEVHGTGGSETGRRWKLLVPAVSLVVGIALNLVFQAARR